MKGKTLFPDWVWIGCLCSRAERAGFMRLPSNQNNKSRLTYADSSSSISWRRLLSPPPSATTLLILSPLAKPMTIPAPSPFLVNTTSKMNIANLSMFLTALRDAARLVEVTTELGLPRIVCVRQAQGVAISRHELWSSACL